MKASPFPGTFRFHQIFAVIIALALFAAPLRAQQPAQPPRTAPPRQAEAEAPTFDTLLAADAYKLYGEVRNVGTLLGSGGAGEIVDPIIKLADPGPQFKSIVGFLKKNSEALGSSRLMFAGWPARTDVPTIFVAIEFPTNEDANKFAPKLETFLPTILPPVPDATPESSSSTGKQNDKAAPKPAPAITSSPQQPPAEHLPFVITHRGNLVFITDKSFKFEKLHPGASKALFQDPNFRIARDQFASESIFLFMNVELEDRTIPKPSPTPVLTEAEKEQLRRDQEEAERKQQEEMRAAMEAEKNRREQQMIANGNPQPSAVLGVQAAPTPTLNKEQQAQRTATSQIGSLLDAIGYGEPEYPEAVGFALSLDGNEYILRAILVDKPEAKKVLIPFIPQLQSGPPITADAASVLPDDTEVFVSASVDLAHTYEGMRKAAEQKAKSGAAIRGSVAQDGSLITHPVPKEPEPDVFAQFEKKAAFHIKDDLLPALGNEIALAGSLKALQGAGGLGLGMPVSSSPTVATEPGADKEGEKDPKDKGLFPMLLIEVKDRDAARRLMPRILDGLGIGEANLLAQTEKREDTEMVNYAGIFAYAFVGNFVVISDAPTVRRVIDANVNHQTLSSNTVFRNSRRWQSRGTLGQIYVSPALMEGYQNEVRKQAANMDATLRDFLLGLDPNSEAITYAVSNEGLGTQHELHLPKNLILTMVAGISSATKNPPPEANEMVAGGILGFIASLEEQYKKGPGKGSYGSMQQLTDSHLFQPEQFEKYGYTFEITANSDSFEAVATPREYGKTGKRSFFVDKSGVVRGDDHGGAPATVSDKPIQQ